RSSCWHATTRSRTPVSSISCAEPATPRSPTLRVGGALYRLRESGYEKSQGQWQELQATARFCSDASFPGDGATDGSEDGIVSCAMVRKKLSDWHGYCGGKEST